MSQTARFSRKKLLNVKRVLIYFCNFVWNVPHSKSTQRDMIINAYWSSCEVPIIFFIFERNLNCVERFSKPTRISNFMKIRPVSAELFRADRRIDRQTDVTKLIVACRKFFGTRRKFVASWEDVRRSVDTLVRRLPTCPITTFLTFNKSAKVVTGIHGSHV